MKKFFFILLVVLLGSAVAAWLAGAKPEIRLTTPLKAVGRATPVTVKVTSGRSGVRHFRASLEQGGAAYPVFEETGTGARWKIWRARQRDREFHIVAGRQTAPPLKDGPARLVLEASSDDLRGASTIQSMDIVVRTEPPRLSVDGAQHYINQGGCELVVFTVSEGAAESGVRVGRYQFRSWPVAGGSAGSRFSLFAFPYDVPAETMPLVYARDEAGNEATAAFWFRVFPKKYRSRDLDLTDDFLQKVVREIEPSGSGDLLKDFLKINGETRRQNNRQLSDLRARTEERFLWSKPFRQLSDSKVESQFADHRKYLYRGQKVDEQDHLGFDLAVTAHVSVVAANDGKVVFGDRLGIYGNCVVIDHGYGLQSIYGHLSSIGVKVGDAVRQGQEIGRSGSTGLAGGDHLHFSMQVDGVQINPTEWWDEHWIHDRILLKFPDQRLPG